MCIQLTIENASRAYRRNPAHWAGPDKALMDKNLDFFLKPGHAWSVVLRSLHLRLGHHAQSFLHGAVP